MSAIYSSANVQLVMQQVYRKYDVIDRSQADRAVATLIENDMYVTEAEAQKALDDAGLFNKALLKIQTADIQEKKVTPEHLMNWIGTTYTIDMGNGQKSMCTILQQSKLENFCKRNMINLQGFLKKTNAHMSDGYVLGLKVEEQVQLLKLLTEKFSDIQAAVGLYNLHGADKVAEAMMQNHFQAIDTVTGSRSLNEADPVRYFWTGELMKKLAPNEWQPYSTYPAANIVPAAQLTEAMLKSNLLMARNFYSPADSAIVSYESQKTLVYPSWQIPQLENGLTVFGCLVK